VDILVASHSRRATNQDADIHRNTGVGPRSRNVSRPDPEVASQDVAQVLAGIRLSSPPFDGDSEADIEPMQVPHRSKMSNRGTTVLDDSYEPTIPESVEMELEPEEEIVLQPEHPAVTVANKRRMGYFDLHPERRPAHPSMDNDDEGLHELNIRAPVENLVEPPRRSDVTESVYSSSGGTPPAAPVPALEVVTSTTMPLHPRSPQPPLPSPTLSPQTPTPTTALSPRELQRQQEVRDRLSGKPGPKAGALIEMYRERERQAGGSSPNRNSSAGAKLTQAQAQAAKSSVALPTLPEPEPEMEPVSPGPSSTVEGADSDLVGPPALDPEGERNSPYRYVHGAPLHNVEEEEEED
jgi:hypothetical protein